MGCTSTGAFTPLVLLPISPHPPNLLINRKLNPSSTRVSLSLCTSRRRHDSAVSRLVVVSAQSNFFQVVQRVISVGKDGIEAGTKLVPDSVPRPIARVSVMFAAVSVLLFALKSFLSTVFFALSVMGLVYFVYLALNKDKGSRVDSGPSSTDGTEPTSTDEALEEARKIMEKYK